MPLYEYKCQQCGSRYERIERPSAPSDSECPECGGIARRLLGAPALKFKGSGWYVNDYGKGNGFKPTESEKQADTDKSADTSTKTEKTTEKKAEEKTEKKSADTKVA